MFSHDIGEEYPFSLVDLQHNHCPVEGMVSNSSCFSKHTCYLLMLFFLSFIPRNRITGTRVYIILIFTDLPGLFSKKFGSNPHLQLSLLNETIFFLNPHQK